MSEESRILANSRYKEIVAAHDEAVEDIVKKVWEKTIDPDLVATLPYDLLEFFNGFHGEEAQAAALMVVLATATEVTRARVREMKKIRRRERAANERSAAIKRRKDNGGQN